MHTRFTGQIIPRQITIQDIIEAVSEKFGIQPWQLRLKSNEAHVVYPRQIGMYLARELTHSSLPQIGKAFGGKHHTTVMHSLEKIETLKGQGRELQALLDGLRQVILSKKEPDKQAQ